MVKIHISHTQKSYYENKIFKNVVGRYPSDYEHLLLFQRPEFDSQHPHDCSQTSVIPDLSTLKPSSGILSGTNYDAQTHIQSKPQTQPSLPKNFQGHNYDWIYTISQQRVNMSWIPQMQFSSQINQNLYRDIVSQATDKNKQYRNQKTAHINRYYQYTEKISYRIRENTCKTFIW